MLRKKIPQRVTSALLAFVMLITSIPFMSWTAIAQTIVPAVLAAEDDSVAETSTDASVTSDGHIKVNSPTDLGVYIEGDGQLNDDDLKVMSADAWTIQYIQKSGRV